ncbi:MAG: cytochrome c oxidase subunit II [Vicinamibacterales bacterium]
MFSAPPLFPEQASTIAPQVDALYFFLIAVTVFFSGIIAVAVATFAVKYRRKKDTDVGEPIHGSVALEIVWTVIPFLIAMAIFGWSSVIYFKIVRPPAETLEIYAVGKRWMWKFQHIDGQREINELHLPVGRAVKLTMSSEDVIHDVFVPAFRVKADAIPGRLTSIWFTPTKSGEYHLFCAEYCGTKHSGMIGKVVVMEPQDYQQWLEGGPNEGTLASRGQKLFKDLACISCHTPEGNGRGPSLHGVFGSEIALANGTTITADDNYIRESILTPQVKLVAGYQPQMPTFQGLVNEEGVMALLEYVKSLRKTATPEP